MSKNLVIVESPAKAKTIERFLGKDFVVESSFGHIVDLPSKELGVNVEGDFLPNYSVSSDKKAVVKKLKALAKKADTVWLASDEDREGEAIAWHLYEQLKLKDLDKESNPNNICCLFNPLLMQIHINRYKKNRHTTTYCEVYLLLIVP